MEFSFDEDSNTERSSSVLSSTRSLSLTPLRSPDASDRSERPASQQLPRMPLRNFKLTDKPPAIRLEFDNLVTSEQVRSLFQASDQANIVRLDSPRQGQRFMNVHFNSIADAQSALNHRLEGSAREESWQGLVQDGLTKIKQSVHDRMDETVRKMDQNTEAMTRQIKALAKELRAQQTKYLSKMQMPSSEIDKIKASIRSEIEAVLEREHEAETKQLRLSHEQEKQTLIRDHERKRFRTQSPDPDIQVRPPSFSPTGTSCPATPPTTPSNRRQKPMHSSAPRTTAGTSTPKITASLPVTPNNSRIYNLALASTVGFKHPQVLPVEFASSPIRTPVKTPTKAKVKPKSKPKTARTNAVDQVASTSSTFSEPPASSFTYDELPSPAKRPRLSHRAPESTPAVSASAPVQTIAWRHGFDAPSRSPRAKNTETVEILNSGSELSEVDFLSASTASSEIPSRGRRKSAVRSEAEASGDREGVWVEWAE